MTRKTLILSGLLLALAACEHDPAAPADVLTVGEAPAFALVRSTWPSAEDPGPPFYARVESLPDPFLIADGWAVIAFYRDPACVRPDFDLLDFFDPPAAFGCALTVTGSAHYQGELFSGPPKIAQAKGAGAVPFWFVPLASALAAIQDGTLTIGELAALPGLIEGHATIFNEMLHPHPEGGIGGHPNPMLTISARGVLEDGRSFQFQFTRTNDDEVRNSRVAFR